jgi:hypothetical protein
MDKTISRQRRWQIKKEALGLCILCGHPASRRRKTPLCEKHYIAHLNMIRVPQRERQRQKFGWVRRYPGAKSYHEEKS